jgi:site-specific DNA recombinase
MMQCDSIKHSDSVRHDDSVRAALYARVSTQQQVQDDTIASQVHSIEQRISADGLLIEQEMRFIDDGYSGSTLVRPALERLRDMADAGAIDRLYLLSPDRLARNYAYQVVLVDELRRCGVEIVFLNHELGRSPEGDMLLQVQGIVAQYERAQIMERSRRGKLHAARRGCVSVLTQAPYGYRYIPKYHGGGDAALNIVLEHAAVVRQIFSWIGTERVSLREVRRRLEKQGVLSPTGKDHWGRGTIWNILNNPAYMGQAAYGRRRTGERRKRLRPYRHASEQPRRPHSQYTVPSEQWVRLAVPAIVDADLFDAVSEQLKDNRRRCRARLTNTPALLGGLTVCARCGYSLCAMKHKSRTTDRISYNYYRCIGRDSHRNGGQAVCDNKAVNAAQLDTAVWRDVCDLLDDPARIQEEYTRRLQGPDDQSLAGEKQKLIDAANKTRRAITRLLDAWTDGLIEKTEFESRTRSARARLEQLEAQIKSQSQLETGQAELRLIIGSLGAFADKIKQGLSTADLTIKRDIIKALVKRVEVNQEEIRIVYRINPNQADHSPARPFLQHCPADA